MHELINDPIDVTVSFSQNGIIPKQFNWNQKTYDVKTVNLVHSVREGTKKIFYFSVSDLTNYFKLRLDAEFLEWQLVELYTDG